MRFKRHCPGNLHIHHGMRQRVRNLLLALSLCLLSVPFYSQEKPPSGQQSAKAEGTIRVKVALVQTDVMVFDRQDRFVDNLTQDQFQLLVDGKPQPLSFFERVSTQGPSTASPVEKTRGTKGTTAAPAAESGPEAGRTLLFFLDDWHLSAESIMRTKAALLNLIEKSMGVNDRGAIFTATSQLGFLQQLTDNKAVLRLAVARMAFTNETVRDLSRPAMNEVQAVAIEQNDPDLLAAFVDATIKAEGLTEADRNLAVDIVRHRASALAMMSSEISARTLTRLANVVRSCTALPGHKVIFFLSDGFVLQQQKDDVVYRIRQVTDAAARAGIVIYTLDTRGLVVGLPTAASPPGINIPASFSDVTAYQDGLNALAADTGGRFMKNTNALEESIVNGIEETSRYYLLGWHVDPDKLHPGRLSTIRVSLKDRPDLRVQVRLGSLDLSNLIKAEPTLPAVTSQDPKAIGNALVKALEFPWPLDALPTYLYAGYVYYPDKGFAIDVSLQADVEPGDSGAGGAAGSSSVEVMGVIANREGATVTTFRETLPQPASPVGASKSENLEFRCSRLIAMDPGLYQVRVAARDSRSGKIGSAHGWIEVPKAAVGKVVLSSVFLKENPTGVISQAGPAAPAISPDQFSVNCRFPDSAHLSFMVQIYNPAALPIQFQAKAYRGNRAVAQYPPQVVQSDVQAPAWPRFVGGDFPTDGLGTGSYVLEVSLSDPAGKAVASQRTPFWIR